MVQIDTTRIQLNWTHAQLACALTREHSSIRDTAAPIGDHAARYDDYRREIRGHILLEIDPFGDDLSDDEILDPGHMEDEPLEEDVNCDLRAAVMEPLGPPRQPRVGPSFRAMRVSAAAPGEAPATYVTRA